MPRKSSASRARTRRIGLLGLLLTTALTPAGIMVGTVAAALIGGLAFHLNRAAPVAPSTPAQSISAKAGNPQHLTIERDGKTVSLVMTEDELAGGGSAGTFDPSGPLFAGLAGDGSGRRSTLGGMPPHASPGTSTPGGGAAPSEGSLPGGAHSPTGPTSNSPSLAGPSGGGFAPGGGSSPNGLPSGGTPPGGPSIPPVAGGPHAPAGNDAPAQPPGEAGAPAKPDENTPPQTNNGPVLILPPPTNVMPQDTLPASNPDTLTPPLAGEPFGPLTPPSDKKVTAQPNAVPEPSMIALFLLGLAGLAWAGRRRANPLRLA
ncbi:MAG TPA: PEP-CTERM sorting domain-containing protein [Thiobacillus sp.]|nr:PEP-CTERM sorting domain-containing protein [Thiobacillus sp.]